MSESEQIQIFAAQGLICLSPQKYIKDVRLILKRKFRIGFLPLLGYTGLEKIPISQGLVTVTHLRSSTDTTLVDIMRNF